MIHNRQMICNNFQKNRGYTLLFAILVSALVLAIGISILNINKKEFLLSSGARDSSAAFYAADSGLECAIYADSNGHVGGDVFNPGSDNTGNLSTSCKVSPVWPPGGKPASFHTPTSGDPVTFIYEAKFGSVVGGSCAIVTVTKTADSDGNPRTVIFSKGYNTGWDNNANRCNLQSVKRVERAIQYAF